MVTLPNLGVNPRPGLSSTSQMRQLQNHGMTAEVKQPVGTGPGGEETLSSRTLPARSTGTRAVKPNFSCPSTLSPNLKLSPVPTAATSFGIAGNLNAFTKNSGKGFHRALLCHGVLYPHSSRPGATIPAALVPPSRHASECLLANPSYPEELPYNGSGARRRPLLGDRQSLCLMTQKTQSRVWFPRPPNCGGV